MNIELEYKLSDVINVPVYKSIDIDSRRYITHDKEELSIDDSNYTNIFSVSSSTSRYIVSSSDFVFISNTNGYRLKGFNTSKEVLIRNGDIKRSIYISTIDESEITELISNFNMDIDLYIKSHTNGSVVSGAINTYISINAYYLLKNIISIMSKYFTEDIYFRVKEIDEEYLELVHMELKLS